MVAVHVLNTAGLLTPDKAAEVRAVAEETCDEVTHDLQIRPADVVICHFPGYAIREYGLGGFAPGPNTALISIDPANPNFAGWRESLPMSLAHELHHLARWQGPGYGSTLLDSLVSEGTATLYEADGFHHVPIYARSEQDPAALWQMAQPHLQATDQHRRWFFGAGDLPRWAGYFLGYELARRYCTATTTTPGAAAHVPAAAFLDTAW